jgi:asparagine synthase (glutamine-hydrolysing)
MCGFVGSIGLNKNVEFDLKTIVKMNNTIKHRGPDGEGYAIFGNIEKNINISDNVKLIVDKNSKYNLFLAHRRLSIIDRTELANQPIQDVNKEITVVFNGEIYNFQEIRKELSNEFDFITDHSDTEVIIYAYKKWGIDFIYKLRGMFAIVIWDSKKETLYLIRDRIGIKPLYYTIVENEFYFASEIKALLVNKKIKREIDYEAVYDYLSFLVSPAPKTLFKQIFKLPAGHYIEVKQGNVSEPIEYWDVFDNNVDLNKVNIKDIKQELLCKFKESVKLRGIADVPVGTFLSGGIDSTLNTKLFAEITNYKVKSFSIGYKNDDKLLSYTNEFEYAKIAAKYCNAEYYQKELSQQDLIDFLPDLIHYQDEPIGDPVCMAVYYVSKLAKENGITVAQVGEGSDEIFHGYSNWSKFVLIQQIGDFTPKILKKLGLKLLKRLKKDEKKYYELLKRSINNERVFWGGAEAFTETQKEKLIDKGFRNRYLKDYTSWKRIENLYNKFLNKNTEKSIENWMSYLDLKLRLPELLLMRVDKMSMAVSLEARVPFLDHKFVEFSLSIPSKYRRKKQILKDAIRGIIPDEIIDRKKQGFDVPVYDWIMDELGNIAKDKILFFNNNIKIFNEDYINRLFKNKQNRQIWFLLNLALWWEKYIYEK